jgi:hypothetical protein
MAFTMRLRKIVVHGVLAGTFALGLGLGIGGGEAAASTAAAFPCAAVYDAATYAGNRYLSASRRGDTVSADWWWSIYESLERSYVKGGCLSNEGGSPAA